MAKPEKMVYPVLSKEIMLHVMGFPSEEAYQAYQRKKEREWLKTHEWVKPICAKCGTKTSSCGKVGILKTEKYYCARCSAKSTTLEGEDMCACLIMMKELLDRNNIQLWTDDAHHSPTIECPEHHTTASFTYINQYD